MGIHLPDTHILYTSLSSVRQIIQPLKRAFNIKTFCYVKVNSDLSRVHLDTNYEWNQLFYKNVQHYYDTGGLSEGYHWESGYTLMSLLDDEECIADSRKFDVGDGIMFTEHKEGCTEIVFMALSANYSPLEVNNLLNNIDLLKQFIPYFCEQASEIIAEAEKSPIILPFLNNQDLRKTAITTDDLAREYKASINPNFTALMKLTKREVECFNAFLKGMTNKEIGNVLDISTRTVEKHLMNVKDKMGYKTLKKLAAEFITFIRE